MMACGMRYLALSDSVQTLSDLYGIISKPSTKLAINMFPDAIDLNDSFEPLKINLPEHKMRKKWGGLVFQQQMNFLVVLLEQLMVGWLILKNQEMSLTKLIISVDITNAMDSIVKQCVVLICCLIILQFVVQETQMITGQLIAVRTS